MTASVASHPVRVATAPLWPSVAVFAGLLAALCVYLVVTLSGSASNSGPTTHAPRGGDQNNQLCVPAPSTRFC